MKDKKVSITNKDTPHHCRTLAIIGIVIGGIMLLVTIGACVVCVVCMCKQKSSSGHVVQPYNNNSNHVLGMHYVYQIEQIMFN